MRLCSLREGKLQQFPFLVIFEQEILEQEMDRC